MDGTRVCFWMDPRCGSSVVKHSSTNLYELAVNKNEIVAKIWDQIVGSGS